VLVSHKYRFIFIKTVKTAGTSIEVDLSKMMGSGDIVTKIFPSEEGHVPRNYILNGIELYNHMPATEVRKLIGESIFNSYLKFCVEREPVDKCISHYSMRKNSSFHNKNMADLTWNQYVENGSFPVDCRKYTDTSGNLVVDRILHYENLNMELRELMGELGVPFDGLKALAKSQFRDNAISAKNVDYKHKVAIYAAFSESLPFTGYTLAGQG